MRRLGIAVVLAAAISGCGGEKEITREDYIAEATDVCKRFTAEAREVTERLQDLGEEAHSQDEFLVKAVPLLEELLDVQRDQFAEFHKIEEVLDAARERDAERFSASAEDLSETELRIQEMLRDYGLKHCQDAAEAGAR